MNSFEHTTSPLADGRDIVIYPRGSTWGFRLPEQHTITSFEGLGEVELSTPDHGSSFHLERIEEAEGELRVHLDFPGGFAHAVGSGPRVPETRPYEFPTIDVELERLKNELVKVGGSEQEANAWAQGASYDSHTERLRARIRELRGDR